MAYEAHCTRDRPITRKAIAKLKAAHGEVRVRHEEVAFSEVLGERRCIVCNWRIGPKGKAA